jgi:uncharacterized protein (TIGR02145 family)
MKKLITLILGITLVYSCSSSSDGNGNTNTTVVPVAPSNLIGTVASTTQINLSWTDNSTNETGFIIERKTGTGVYAIVGNTAAEIITYSDSGLTPNTTYTYRMYSNNAVGNSLTYSNELTLTTLPTITTTAVSAITSTSASSGGNITSDGGATITARGICWSTSANPTIALSTKTIDGTGTGAFTSTISALIANTTYYARAYATNSSETNYGNEISFTTPASPTVTDIDGNIYQTVAICNQTWTTTNLNVSKYRNGDVIPQVTDPTAWAALTTGAWRYYTNDLATGAIYGKLYNWYAVVDPRGLAPTGYHIPSDTEWTTLTTCLGGDAVAGGKMKATGTSLWLSPNSDATNSSGFTGLPGGNLDTSGTFCSIGCEYRLGEYGMWWSSSEYSWGAKYFALTYVWGDTRRGFNYKTFGFSVRCVKD